MQRQINETDDKQVQVNEKITSFLKDLRLLNSENIQFLKDLNAYNPKAFIDTIEFISDQTLSYFEKIKIFFKSHPKNISQFLAILADGFSNNYFFDALQNLKTYHLLNDVSINKTFQVHDLEKIEKPVAAEVIKKSRKDFGNEKKRSELIINDNLHLFIEHGESEVKSKKEKYLSGSYGTIKKLFKTATDEEPKYLLKRYHGNSGAVKETKYGIILNKEAYYFRRNNKLYYISIWKKGKSLDSYTKEELSKFSIEDRLLWLLSVLTQLDQLHQKYQVHGDIKGGNLILDTIGHTLSLVDFGSAGMISQGTEDFTHLPPKDSYSLKPNYHAETDYTFSTDIYFLGTIAAQIFPELYVTHRAKPFLTISEIKKTESTPLSKSIIKLINAMTVTEREQRCTAQDALNYCKRILENKNSITEESIRKIAADTIDHNTLTVEDVLHQSLRPVSM